MRPAEFTPEAIIQAGQALQAAGRNITGFALRQRVGGGNPARLRQLWDEHLSSQAVARAEPVAELPIEVAEEVAAVTKALTERLSALAVELNDKAVKAAERRVAEVIRTAGEQREQADASQTVKDLETQLDAAEAAGAELEKRLAALQAAHQAQAVELAQVRERLALTEQAARSAAEEHGAERTRYQQQVEQVRADLAEQRQAALTVAGERDQARAELATVRAQGAAAAEQLATTRRECDEARGDAGAAREEAARLAGQLQAHQEQSAALLARLAPAP